MEPTKLMKLTYCDPKNGICLTGYADVVVWDSASGQSPALAALRFGGCPEVVCGLADAIYGGAAIEIEGEVRLTLQAKEKGAKKPQYPPRKGFCGFSASPVGIQAGGRFSKRADCPLG